MEMAGIVRRNVVVLLVSAMAMDVGPAWGDPFIIGIASVIDGDTLEIRGQRIRLHGIDAPESGQFCEKDGKQYRCGQQAALALSDKIGRATIRCERRDIDRYKRIVAVCRLGDVDLNAWMVREGWAISYRQYSRDYIDDESAARTAKAGIWAGRFIEPSRWRRGDRLAAEKAGDPAAGSCQIKGNISRKGERIYHVPGGRYYGPTRIDESKGERWFCSEDEARRAGWRRSRQ
jgi:endonuclease YncB( thermonuclease family)